MISTPQKAFMMPFAPELEKSKWFSFSNRPNSPQIIFSVDPAAHNKYFATQIFVEIWILFKLFDIINKKWIFTNCLHNLIMSDFQKFVT